MATFSYSNADGEFTDMVATAEGSDVLTRFNDIKSFLNTVNEYTNKITILTPETVVNSAAETSLTTLAIPVTNATVLAGNCFQGMFMGAINTTAAANTLRVRVRYGGIAGTVLLDSGLVNLEPSLVNSLFKCDFQLVVNTTGVAGTVECQGMIMGGQYVGSFLAMGTAVDGSTDTAPIVVDTTATTTIVTTVQFGSAVVGHSISARTGSVIKL